MKAAIFHGVGEPLSIEEVDIAAPGPREILIKTAAVGLCRSDLHFLDGAYPHPTPVILGHEASGVVEAVGDAVTAFAVGDHVVTFLAPFCGTCRLCTSGQHSLCQDSSTKRGKDEPPRLSLNGEALPQFLNISGFAEKMLVHENGAVKIDKKMPLDRAALLGCAVITGASAIFNEAKLIPGESVAIIGAGGIGLSAINAAKIAGAGTIIAIDPLPQKRKLALKMGATHVVDANLDGAIDAVMDICPGGVDYAIEAVGRPQTAEMAWNISRRGGIAIILGMIAPGQKLSINGPTLLSGKTLKGSLMGGAKFKTDMPRLAHFYLNGQLDLDNVIAERISLSKINEAFDTLRRSENARSVIIFE
ncbi:alcohol dehydrogenase [Sphingorhabdus lutea]|uniref:Alcohol dehydrogenase n=1 Tax=Sphingorhabdus lutea TaxID=1913578 RepID=A0A1L3JAU6_9SPHN|nr:Zn-dependent alcohol dehydrogenase [Sphingorhabdus lutea]APG62246.1 alcohol dehydrogenase [Sphingorhabdus lutea]